MKKKFLIVDDSQAILHLLSSYLEQKGYEVATAEDGLKALDVLESFRPDIMFVDLIMPGIKGDKLCRIIRKMPEYDSVILVIISATAAEEKIDFVSLGADACIAKGPLKIMLESVSQVLEHLQNNEIGPLTEKIFGSDSIFERDITRELLASNKHFEVTLDNMDEGLVELTGSGKITFVNCAAAQLLGLPEEKLLSSYFPEIFDATNHQLIQGILARQDNTIARIGEDTPVIFHDNYLLIKFVPFHDQNSKHFIIMIHDPFIQNATLWCLIFLCNFNNIQRGLGLFFLAKICTIIITQSKLFLHYMVRRVSNETHCISNFLPFPSGNLSVFFCKYKFQLH